MQSQALDSHIVNWPFTEEQKQYNAAETVFSTNSARTTRHPHTKKKERQNLDRFYTLHKHKMGHRPKFNTQYCKILEDNIGENLDDFRYGSDLLFR